MSKIVMASNNRHKIKEIEAFLLKLCPNDRDGKPFEILSLADIGYTDDIVEDGDNFEANALIKAREVAKLGYIGIADDSGLCVDALNGEPGVYSARYAGGHDDADNNRKILENLKDVPRKREARISYPLLPAYSPTAERSLPEANAPAPCSSTTEATAASATIPCSCTSL